MKKMLSAILALCLMALPAFAGDKITARESSSAGLVSHLGVDQKLEIHGRYTVTAYDKDGRLKWTDTIDNLVTTVGKNSILDNYLSGSSWTTGTVYMMLKSTGTAVIGDTMTSHGSWTELNISASSGIRQAITFSGASAGVKAGTAAVAWSITSSGTVAGCAIVIGGTSANANTTGTLLSAGDFASARSVVNGDTLNVTYSLGL